MKLKNLGKVVSNAYLKQLRHLMLGITKQRINKQYTQGQTMTLMIDGMQHTMLHYPSSQVNAPVYFDIHGGGFCWGSMEEGDLICQRINEQLDFECYALDYPRTPENPYPIALEWLYNTIRHLALHAGQFNIDPQKIVIGGRSAGGNLSAALCILAEERKEFTIACQVLDHMVSDLSGTVIHNDDRYRNMKRQRRQGERMLERLFSAYAMGNERMLPTCSPVCASKEILKKMPPTVIQTCEMDSVRVDGEVFATMLREAGVDVTYQCYPGVTHGFTEQEGPEQEKGIHFLVEGIRKYVLQEQ